MLTINTPEWRHDFVLVSLLLTYFISASTFSFVDFERANDWWLTAERKKENGILFIKSNKQRNK